MQDAAAKDLALIRSSARYEVSLPFAAGGMGTVHSAFDRSTQRQVAYKRMKQGAEHGRPQRTALFQREYDTLTRLKHPNIVEVYDFGFDDEGAYYTMELLPGDDLAGLAPLSWRDACRLLRDVASALALLHARRLVHRDVSPNNVRLTSGGRAKLIDFGALTPFGKPSLIVGTAAFMAPECVTGGMLDQRTDLYALGALAYWTLTRRTHIAARSIDQLVEALGAVVQPPSQHLVELPRELDDLVLALLQRDPLARPTTAADVIERLTALAALPPEEDERRVAYSYLQHPPLIAREQALEQLSQARVEAMAGTGRVVLIEAEQGLGRSALLDRVAIEAQLSGGVSLSAKGGLHKRPFSAARSLVQAGLALFPELGQRLQRRDPRFFALVALPLEQQLRSSVAKPKAASSAIDASQRHALVTTALADALLELSRASPLSLLIDDAHEIDAESLAVFASLLDRLVERPLLLVLSARSGQPATDVQAFDMLTRQARRVELRALAAEQLRELVITIFGAVPHAQRLVAWLHAETAGNPAQCLDLARLLLTRGEIRYTGGTFTLPYEFTPQLGEQHASALLAKLGGVSPHAFGLARLLSLHAGALEPRQLAIGSGLTLRDVLLALEELSSRAAVVSGGERVSCASQSLRAALQGTFSSDERRAAHLALARAFAGAKDDELDDTLAAAHHLLSAGGNEAGEGAMLLAQLGDGHKFELAMRPGAVALLEQALRDFEARGLADEECVGLLAPLSIAGFFGQLDAQRRYLDRTLRTLSQLCGMHITRRLRAVLHPKLALIAGLFVALLAHVFTLRKINRRSLVKHLEAFGGVVGTAVASAASTWDTVEGFRVTAYLEPFSAASRRLPMYLIREFCLATSELGSGKLYRAAERYRHLLAILDRPVRFFSREHTEQLRCGALHGQAQALVTNADPVALQLADELERRGPFYAPHAECVRMTHHAYRGDVKAATVHRERSELLAYRGGTSWSSVCILTLRTAQACVHTGDTVGLVRALADLHRLAPLAPSVAMSYELTQAHLDVLRGRAERALLRYEQLLPTEAARNLPTHPIDRSMHARALSQLGRHAEAKALCLSIIAEQNSDAHDMESVRRVPVQRLALAEAALGNIPRAVELLESLIEKSRERGNPLALGTLHRDRAYVAVLAFDRAGFDQHAALMSEHFQSTQNPSLIQQCEALRSEAVRRGVIVQTAQEREAVEDLDSETALATAAGDHDEGESEARLRGRLLA